MTRKVNMGEGLLSIADISRHFSLPESTARYYCKRFAQYIPSVGDGRRRRYRRETLDVIEAILEQMQKSRTAVAVEDALEAKFPRNALAVPEESSPQERGQAVSVHFTTAALQMLERQTIALEGITQIMQVLAERLPRTAEQSAVDHASALREEVETLRMLLNASEKTQQADLEQLRRWMTRVILTRSGGGASSSAKAHLL
ncbi:MAG: MerR family transcriptional regulator [Desulfovibrio sp.]|jgi:DNA-binding transcriptional MerR regulator|nr:MerR family transcriptional regulator [Desulfovibrio sp.]